MLRAGTRMDPVRESLPGWSLDKDHWSTKLEIFCLNEDPVKVRGPDCYECYATYEQRSSSRKPSDKGDSNQILSQILIPSQAPSQISNQGRFSNDYR